MKRVFLALTLALGFARPGLPQASPYSISNFAAQSFTAIGTGATIPLNGLTSGTSTVGSSFASGNVTVTGTGLTTATFGVLGSSDNGVTYYPVPIVNTSVPGDTPVLTETVTANGVYQISLGGYTHIKFVVSGTFTASSLSLKLVGSPNAPVISRRTSGPGSGVSSFNTRTGAVSLTAGDVNAVGPITNSTSGTAGNTTQVNGAAVASSCSYAGTDGASHVICSTAPAPMLPTGATMTGALILSGDPITGLQAATKAYVDAHSSSLPSGAGNQVLATPNGSTGVTALRALVAADVPTLNQNTTGTASALSAASVLPSGTTATTQSSGDNSNLLATTAFVKSIPPFCAGDACPLGSQVNVPWTTSTFNVALPISPTDTTITVLSTAGAPGPKGCIYLQFAAQREFACYNSIPDSTHFAGVTRGHYGTTAQNWTGTVPNIAAAVGVTNSQSVSINSAPAAVYFADSTSLFPIFIGMSNVQLGVAAIIDGSVGSSFGFNALGAATSSSNIGSTFVFWNGSSWTGSAATGNSFSTKLVFGAGVNPRGTMTYAHNGTATGPGIWQWNYFQMTDGSMPCDALSRHVIGVIAGGTGVSDTFQYCGKDASNTYAWRPLFPGGGGGALFPGSAGIVWNTSTTASRNATQTDFASFLGTVKYVSQSGCATPVASVQGGVSAVGYTDSYACIQGLITSAGTSAGISTVVIDAPYALSAGLLVPSNVHVKGLGWQTGIILLPNSNATMFMNAAQATPANCTATTPDGASAGFEVSNTCNANIEISDMYLNFNSIESITNADHKTGTNGKWVWGIQMAGLKNLKISNIYMYDPASFAVGITNTDGAVVENAGMWARNNSGAYGANTDWVHTNGPAKNVDIRFSKVDQGGDDACAANEWDGWSPGGTIPGDLNAQPNTAWQQGPIDNYRCHHNNFVNVVAAMRVLNSGGGRAGTNISFDNIVGAATQQVAEVSKYFNTGVCNVADVTFDKINMVGGIGNGNYVFNGCTGGVYKLSGVTVPVAPTTAKPLVTGNSAINQINLEGVTIANLTGAQLTGSWINLTGSISQMNASINWLTRSGDTSTLFGGTGPNNLVANVTGNSANFENWGTKPTTETILSPAISLLEGTSTQLPQLKMYNTSAVTNGGRWDIIPLGSGTNSTLAFRVLSDAGLTASNIMTFTRSGTTPLGVQSLVPIQTPQYVSSNAETVTFSATPTFSATIDTSFITLTNNVTSSTLAAGVSGAHKTLFICQDATGSRTFVPPTNVIGLGTIGSTPSTCNTQTLIYSTLSGHTNWYATGAMIMNMP